jgi:hypothetical protein
MCIYDAHGALAGRLALDRAGLTCNDYREACWTAIRANPPAGAGYKFADRVAGNDGITSVRLNADGRRQSAVQLRARNDAARGHRAYPVGIAQALDGQTRATMQMMGSDGTCLSADVVRLGTPRPGEFRGRVE